MKKVKTININKLVKDIEENATLGICTLVNLRTQFAREVIDIIKKNIKEIEPMSYKDGWFYYNGLKSQDCLNWVNIKEIKEKLK